MEAFSAQEEPSPGPPQPIDRQLVAEMRAAGIGPDPQQVATQRRFRMAMVAGTFALYVAGGVAVTVAHQFLQDARRAQGQDDVEDFVGLYLVVGCCVLWAAQCRILIALGCM